MIPASWPAERATRPAAGGWDGIMPTPQPLYYVPIGPEPWPTGPGASTPPMRSPTPGGVLASPPAGPPRFDRLQLTAWALLRGTGKGAIRPPRWPAAARSAEARPARG